MQKSKPLLALVGLLVVLALGFAGYSLLGAGRTGDDPARTGDQAEQDADAAEQDAGSTEQNVGEVAMLADYDARVYTAQGDAATLSEIADGKPLVINFWATWCPYCVEELPDFQEIYGEYGDRVSFAFVDVADGTRETAEDAAAWLAENGFDNLPAYYDTDLDATTMYGIRSLPTTVLVSADGEIVSVSVGAIEAASLRGALDSLL